MVDEAILSYVQAMHASDTRRQTLNFRPQRIASYAIKAY